MSIGPRVLFFGVPAGRSAGHFLCDPSGRWLDARTLPAGLQRLDGVWCHPAPASVDDCRSGRAYRGDDTQGRAYIHHVDGWTVTSWWDRSADHRGGCNAVFLAEGRRSFAEMLDLGREHFPREMARMEAAYPVALAGPGLAPDGDDHAADAFLSTFDALHPAVQRLVLQRLRRKEIPR